MILGLQIQIRQMIPETGAKNENLVGGRVHSYKCMILNRISNPNVYDSAISNVNCISKNCLAVIIKINTGGMTFSRHFSLSFIMSGRSSGLHPVSSHSCWMYVSAFARPYVGVHECTSLMSSSLLLQKCLACLVRLTWIVFVIGGWWPYSWCLVGCCRQDLFKIARSILV